MAINWGIIDLEGPAKIAGSFQQGKQNRLAQLAAGRADELEQMKLDEARQGATDRKTLRDIYAQTAGDTGQAVSKLYAAGMGAQAQEMQKSQREQQAAKIKQATDALSLMKGLSSSVMEMPTYESADYALRQFEQATGQELADQRAMLQSMAGDPNKIRQWAYGHAVDADMRKSEIDTISLGDVSVTTATNPYTLDRSVIGQAKIGMSPSEQSAAANRPFNSDGSPNQAYQRFAVTKAKAGAPTATTIVEGVKMGSNIANFRKDVQDTIKPQLELMNNARLGLDQLSAFANGNTKSLDAVKKAIVQAVDTGHTNAKELAEAGVSPEIITGIQDRALTFLTGRISEKTMRELGVVLNTVMKGQRSLARGEVEAQRGILRASKEFDDDQIRTLTEFQTLGESPYKDRGIDNDVWDALTPSQRRDLAREMKAAGGGK